MENTNKKKTNEEKDKERERAKKAEKRALIKIENNIRRIHKDPDIQKSMEKIQKNFNIYPGIYERHKEGTQTMRSISKITNFLKKKWILQNFKDKKVSKIINTHLAKCNISEELNRLNDKIAAAEAKKNLSDIKIYKERYLNDMVDNFINGVNPIFSRHKINQDIWKSILGAMLFNIPLDTMIKVKASILPDYMPTINKHLQIQINELTTLGDLEYINPKIKAIKKWYKKKHKNKNCERTKKSMLKKVNNS